METKTMSDSKEIKLQLVSPYVDSEKHINLYVDKETRVEYWECDGSLEMRRQRNGKPYLSK